MTEIKKDKHGLFAYVGGWICRPLKKSKFKEGDKVRGSHPAGKYAYLRILHRIMGCNRLIPEGKKSNRKDEHKISITKDVIKI